MFRFEYEVFDLVVVVIRLRVYEVCSSQRNWHIKLASLSMKGFVLCAVGLGWYVLEEVFEVNFFLVHSVIKAIDLTRVLNKQ